MARLATLPKGQWDQFDRNLNATNLTAEDVVKLNQRPNVLEAMLAAMRAHPDFNLVHNRFTALADKIAKVKAWPGINPEEVDAAVALATKNGTIALYKKESASNPLLDIVITVNRESVPATFLYARDRMWGVHYQETTTVRALVVDDKHVKLIEGAKPFQPNQIAIEVVDLGANYKRIGLADIRASLDSEVGVIPRGVQATQGALLAGFAVIYAALQSPEWVQQMDGFGVPYALAGAILLSVPDRGERTYSPLVRRFGERRVLDTLDVGDRFSGIALPVLQW